MWTRVITAIICLLALFVELGFDSTSPFVREVAAPQATQLAYAPDPGHSPDSASSAHHDGPAAPSHSDASTPIATATTHAASPAGVFVLAPHVSVSRLRPGKTAIPASLEAFRFLRPPIFS